ncbi:MAG: cadherin domain-containing protein, partial [Marinoscillum sp.]
NDLPLYIESLIPSNSETVQINEGENLQFNPVIIDPENREISYSWSVNNVEVSDQTTYLFETDFQSSGNYSIDLKCEDFQGYNHDELTISWSIEVLNINTAPTADDGTFIIDENSTVSTLVGMVTASDLEDDDLTLSITSGNELGAFQIDLNTGELSVADASILDFESNPTFELSVEVSDGVFTDEATITIDLTDINEPPTSADGQFNIDENTLAGTVIGTVESSDPEGDDLTLSITSGNELGAFQIDANTGELSVADASILAFESNPTFELSVEVSDGEFTVETAITINLIEVNEAHWVADKSFDVKENTLAGTVIGSVESSDPEGDDLTFSITSGNELGAFQIDANTGELSVADESILDFESNPTFELSVEVSDGGLTDEATITINLSDINESPLIAAETFAVEENSAAGTAVGTVQASDPEGDDLTYSITSSNDLGAFQIDANTGELSVADASILDFESNPTF